MHWCCDVTSQLSSLKREGASDPKNPDLYYSALWFSALWGNTLALSFLYFWRSCFSAQNQTPFGPVFFCFWSFGHFYLYIWSSSFLFIRSSGFGLLYQLKMFYTPKPVLGPPPPQSKSQTLSRILSQVSVQLRRIRLKKLWHGPARQAAAMWRHHLPSRILWPWVMMGHGARKLRSNWEMWRIKVSRELSQCKKRYMAQMSVDT